MDNVVFSAAGWRIARGPLVIGPFDLTLRAGEVVTLMGPSGIGKTTLLTALLGYEEPDLALAGQRSMDGREIPRGSVPPRSLYIPQRLPFNPNWEVEAFLCRVPWGRRSFLDAIWPGRPSRVRLVRDVLDRLELGKRRRATVAELSGGESQRAALAQMLLLKPRLLVGDEFVSALDPGMAVWVLEQCREALSDARGSAILALHDVHAALHISDRIHLVWPPAVDPVPWEIVIGSSAWDADKLHTALCLARWAKDVEPSDAVRHLVRGARRIFESEAAMSDFLSRFNHTSAAVVDEHGRVTPVEQSTSCAVPIPEPPHAEPRVWPIRAAAEHAVTIGYGIPRPGRSPLRILADSNGVPLDA